MTKLSVESYKKRLQSMKQLIWIGKKVNKLYYSYVIDHNKLIDLFKST